MSKQSSRPGRKNMITSVSVSEEFKTILNKYRVSPTEVFRKGMGVTLYSMGVQEYDTEINQLRLSKANEILKNIDKRDEFLIKLREIKRIIEELDEAFTQLNKSEV